jgi:hypothetical protein
MKAQFYRIVAGSVLLAGFAVACRKDPTASGVGAPAEVILDFSALRLSQGDSATIEARIVDNRLTPLEGDITFASCDASTATVTPNAGFDPQPPTAAQAVVHGVGANVTCITASAEGAKPDSVNVVVLPTSFSGAVSTSTPAGGTILSIASTSVLKFNPAQVAVAYGSYGDLPIVKATTDTVKVSMPYGVSPGEMTISGIAPTYVTGQTFALPLSPAITISAGDYWSGDASWQTAPDITPYLPASGGTSGYILTMGTPNAAVCPEAVLGFGSSGPCMMFHFSLPDTATYNFTVSWEGSALAPDVDVYSCADSTVANFGAACFEDGGAGATGSLPQSTGDFQYPAGDHWFVVEVYDNSTPTVNITVTITRP